MVLEISEGFSDVELIILCISSCGINRLVKLFIFMNVEYYQGFSELFNYIHWKKLVSEPTKIRKRSNGSSG